MKCPKCGTTNIRARPTESPRRFLCYCFACNRHWLDKPQPLKVKDAFAACRRALTMAEKELPLIGRYQTCLAVPLRTAIKAARTSMAKAQKGAADEGQ